MKYFCTWLLLLVCNTCIAQIHIMEQPKPKKDSVAIAKYDSLTNLQPNALKKLTYESFIGQTIMYCGDYDRRPLHKSSFKVGDYFVIDSVLPNNVSEGKYDILALTNINTGERAYEIRYPVSTNYNQKWVVVGFYEKMIEQYVGKKYVYIKDNNILPNYLDGLFNVETGEKVYPSAGSIWTVTSIEVLPFTSEKMRFITYSKRSPVVVVLESEKNEKCYAYIQDNNGGTYESQHRNYAGNDEELHYFLGCFEDKDIYDARKAKKLAAARQARLKAEREKAEQTRQQSERQAARRQSVKNKYGEALAQRILNGEVWIGMTSSMCRDAIGSPSHVNRTRTATCNHEQWVYGTKYIYFENGICTAIQD